MAEVQALPIDSIQVNLRYRRSQDGIEALASSIAELGLLNPITVSEDMVLVAGYRRLEAHRLLGRSSILANVVGLGGLQAELAEIDENLIREDLTELEFAEHLARRKEIYEALHPETRAGGDRRSEGAKSKDNNCLSFVSNTAGMMDKSESTIKLSVQIATAIEEDVRDELRDTPVADRKTDLLALAQMEPAERKAVVEEIAEGNCRSVKQAKKVVREKKEARAVQAQPPITERYQLFLADFRRVQIEAESVDVIITDPPYGREDIPLYGELAQRAAKWLKPGGSLLVMAGQSYLPEVLRQMALHLRYWWTVAYLTPGGQSPYLWGRKVNAFWKPVFWFVKGDYLGEAIGDVVKSAVNDKRFHNWGQSESGIAGLVERFSKPGDVICDPMMGAGTTGVVALCLGRRFIGVDNDEKAYNTALVRIGKLNDARSETGTDGLA